MVAIKEDVKIVGWFDVTIIRAKTGVKEKFRVPNGQTDVGRNYLLNAGFQGASQITAWYIGLIDNVGTPALAAGDTMASHAGWVEAPYYSSPANRGTWTPAAASGHTSQVQNTSPLTFTINANGKSVYGIFITSVNTISGTTGTLWSTGAFGTPPSVNSGDQVNVTYTVAD